MQVLLSLPIVIVLSKIHHFLLTFAYSGSEGQWGLSNHWVGDKHYQAGIKAWQTLAHILSRLIYRCFYFNPCQQEPQRSLSRIGDPKTSATTSDTLRWRVSSHGQSGGSFFFFSFCCLTRELYLTSHTLPESKLSFSHASECFAHTRRPIGQYSWYSSQYSRWICAQIKVKLPQSILISWS